MLLLLASVSLHCDRGIESFDPNEEPAAPDLARIYPNGGTRKAPAMGGGMPGAAAPARRDAPASASASNSGATISGTIELDSGFYADRPANGMLFIIARSRPAGPPLAVLRVPNPSFPHTFELGQAQVMIPTLQFEGEIKLSARLDSDGNAMTKLPGDLVGAVAAPLVPGASGVVLVLDQKL
jgi:hypothetical protein